MLLSLPALMAGNSVVVKPSEVAPLTGAMVVDALAATLPPGVVQLAQGDGAVGSALVSNDQVRTSAQGRRKARHGAFRQSRALVMSVGGAPSSLAVPPPHACCYDVPPPHVCCYDVPPPHACCHDIPPLHAATLMCHHLTLAALLCHHTSAAVMCHYFTLLHWRWQWSR